MKVLPSDSLSYRVRAWLAATFPVDYDSYIHSPRWRRKADAAKRRAGYRCQSCSAMAGEVTLDAHHNNYRTLGFEDARDLFVMCRRCHRRVHGRPT